MNPIRYKANSNNQTGLVQSLQHEVINNGIYGDMLYFSFTYNHDSLGNITKFSEMMYAETVSYVYDGLNQLVRENNTYLNKTITYTYDTGGNLLNKKEYAYTTGTLGTPTKTITYGYTDTNWKDKLTSYDGKAITYDAIGNPLTYDGYTYTWQKGRQLGGITGNGLNMSFAYNSNGLRTKKTVGAKTTEYIYSGNLLMSQSDGTNTMSYLYSPDGKLLGLNYQGAMYYYLYNAQGDVVGMYDNTGELVCEYLYDSWGKVIQVRDFWGTEITDPNHVSNVNPIRYRGYYYDTETGLYYLQTRYYNPQWGRFVNADGYVQTGQDINSNNMFMYCGNNPVNRSDPSGMFWKSIGNFFKGVGISVANISGKVFGSGTTTVYQASSSTRQIIPNLYPITAKSGIRTTTTIYSKGNSSKPISVYSKGRSDNSLLSSAGIKINIYSFTIDLSLGIDNFGLTGLLASGDTTKSFGLKVDLSEFKVGFESTTSVKWDTNTNVTNYTNVSFSGWFLVAAAFIVTGQQMPSNSPAYSY